MHVAIVDEGMNHLYLITAIIEVQPYCKWQPFAIVFAVHAAYLYNGTYFTLSLDAYSFYIRLIFVACCRGDKRQFFANPFVVQTKTVDQAAATFGDISRQRTSVDYHLCCFIFYLQAI